MFSSSKRNKLIIISKRNESVDKLITIFERNELVIIFKRNESVNKSVITSKNISVNEFVNCSKSNDFYWANY